MAGSGVDFQVCVDHDQDYAQGVVESGGAEVGRDQEFVVVRCEDCFARGQDPEYVGCERDVAVARGEGEDLQAGTGGGFEVAGLDLCSPYYARGVVLSVSVMQLKNCGRGVPAVAAPQHQAAHPTAHCSA